jgi:hypothetical protein
MQHSDPRRPLQWFLILGETGMWRFHCLRPCGSVTGVHPKPHSSLPSGLGGASGRWVEERRDSGEEVAHWAQPGQCPTHIWSLRWNRAVPASCSRTSWFLEAWASLTVSVGVYPMGQVGPGGVRWAGHAMGIHPHTWLWASQQLHCSLWTQRSRDPARRGISHFLRAWQKYGSEGSKGVCHTDASPGVAPAGFSEDIRRSCMRAPQGCLQCCSQGQQPTWCYPQVMPKCMSLPPGDKRRPLSSWVPLASPRTQGEPIAQLGSPPPQKAASCPC